MSSVGILAWKSALEDGRPFDVPDFKNEKARKQFEKDDWSPWPQGPGSGTAPPSILGTPKPGKKAIALAKKVWKTHTLGYGW